MNTIIEWLPIIDFHIKFDSVIFFIRFFQKQLNINGRKACRLYSLFLNAPTFCHIRTRLPNEDMKSLYRLQLEKHNQESERRVSIWPCMANILLYHSTVFLTVKTYNVLRFEHWNGVDEKNHTHTHTKSKQIIVRIECVVHSVRRWLNFMLLLFDWIFIHVPMCQQ